MNILFSIYFNLTQFSERSPHYFKLHAPEIILATASAALAIASVGAWLASGTGWLAKIKMATHKTISRLAKMVLATASAVKARFSRSFSISFPYNVIHYVK